MEGGLAGDPKLFPLISAASGVTTVFGMGSRRQVPASTQASMPCARHLHSETPSTACFSVLHDETHLQNGGKEPPISLYCRHNSLPIQQWGSRVAVSVLLPGSPVVGAPGLKDRCSHSGCISRAYSCQRKAAGTWHSFPKSASRPPSTRALPYSGIHLGLSLVHLQRVIVPQQFCLRY